MGSALAAACTGEVPDEGASDDDSATHSLESWIVVERVESDAGSPAVRTNVSAKFVHVGENDLDMARRLVGAGPQIPAPGTCVELSSLEERSIPGSRSALSVDLVDVGDVSLAIQGEDDTTKMSLAPRAFPDIGDFVSGVFYTSPDAALGLPAPAAYRIGATGSPSMQGFDIDVLAPEAPSGLAVAGTTIDAAEEEAAPATIEVAKGRDLELGWAASSREATESLVYVDVRAGGEAHRCTFADAGSAVLPGAMLSEADGEATVTVHRLTERVATIQWSEEPEGQRRFGDGVPKVSTDEAKEARVMFDFARVVRLSIVPNSVR